ncbi:GIY-YIG nuclease family protein [Lysobacter sp. N42]|uniref:GIY-YIG nuclease family protein n=1 Tax=Lysobacter sp. N42 TaxID=2545719 RepID=UPI00104A6CBE|nr:GIY-YIG nuclease family protein [Lysobacter sp. N42]TCZ85030.1 GIY-YIG nuclease family protein [Lysobacter sp. N42]
MTSHPQTIQIFLPAGDPQGLRVAEITTRIVRMIEVPRTLLRDFFAMPESEQVGIYFLFGEDESGRDMAYIGQTGSLRQRLESHDRNKEFWGRVVVAVSLTKSLTATHASYLEWQSIQTAQRAGRYLLQNGNGGACPHAPAPMEADCREIHETIATLLATLGFKIFEPVRRQPASPATSTATYFCRASGADARAVETEEGFVVLEGSTGRVEVVPSFELHGYYSLRRRLIDQGVLAEEGERIRFTRDYPFKSPSAAAACVMGRTANGLVDWRDATGRSLWDLKQATSDSSAEPPPVGPE